MDKMRILITGGSGFIGTYLVNSLLKENVNVLNIDIKEPQVPGHENFWRACDILDNTLLQKIFTDYKPTHVIHLAARTDTDSDILKDYDVNITGTKNLLESIKSTLSVKQVIITSTQFVNQYHGSPKHDEDFAPHTVYGESKVLTEQLTRNADLKCVWTIIRPTNIWGPRHPRYVKEFWQVLKRGRYIHPNGGKPVIRSYGYVGNIVYQIIKILTSESEKINGQVFYVGDQPIDLYDYVNEFSKKLTGKKVKVIPKFFIKIIALNGDLLKLVGIKFPITSSRFVSMTTSNSAPMDKTFEVLGSPPYSLNEGVKETTEWLLTIDKDFWALPK